MGDLLTITLGPRRGTKRGTRASDWYDRGCALADSQPAEAIRCYERALAGCPDLADAHNNLGRVVHDLGRELALAESHYRLALCFAPGVALYWFNLGVVVEDRGRVAEAIVAYEQALTLDASFSDAHFNLARLYELAGRRTGDELLVRRAVRHLIRYRDLGAVAR
ncbi:MAG: tetratricopeptide repeat protein [Kofleriaceae bacterium]